MGPLQKLREKLAKQVLGESHDKIQAISSQLIWNRSPSADESGNLGSMGTLDPKLPPISTSPSKNRKPRRTLDASGFPGGDGLRASISSLPKRPQSDGDSALSVTCEDDGRVPKGDVRVRDSSCHPQGGSAAPAVKGNHPHLSTRQLQEQQYESLKKRYGLAASEYCNWRIKNKIPDGTRVFCMAGAPSSDIRRRSLVWFHGSSISIR